ncbi:MULTISPECIES: hypothetical protein [spotted fever group]|uniref:Ribose-phosphate pyrophosphokinase n=1 Tax=Rickettsia tamurae subsp. buchneri TaxID=1462938 RepID=A0A8E0WM02_9RICK|nr:hypothetical protein [Rickettsia endosymbiont of Ixodes scapularis]EER21443.1 ribose-phosphate pyrophosphokinase [Rickettsia endosymbiont of Ixodes scapularis]KDO03130.1 hypothetical protein REISMN_03285 [Rickettsia tamurae subsp. buchneri]
MIFIDSGETIVKAARFLKEHSALSVVSAFITHAVLSAGSKNSIIDLLHNKANREEFVRQSGTRILTY